MDTATQTARPTRWQIRRALLSAWLDRNEHRVTVTVVVMLGVLLSVILAMALFRDYGMSALDALTISAVSALTTAVVSVFVVGVTADRVSLNVSATWRQHYARTASERDTYRDARDTARTERDALSARLSALTDIAYAIGDERDNLARLILSMVESDDYARDGITALRAYIGATFSLNDYADAFHNSEGIGLRDTITREAIARCYLADGAQPIRYTRDDTAEARLARLSTR